MAKELAQGIRDNVEDIAAAFKKMAIINPNRKRAQQSQPDSAAASVSQSVPAEQGPISDDLRTAQARDRQAIYDGLLLRTMEEKKKKRSKKAVVDENQLSIFDFVA